MNSIGWYKSLDIPVDPEGIRTRVRKLEIWYRLWLAFSMIIICSGVIIMASAEEGTDPFKLVMGLVLAVSGIVGAAATKLQTGVSLSMYRILLTMSKH